MRRRLFDFDCDQWNLARRPGKLLAALFTFSDMFEGRDCANYDMTVHASKAWNGIFQTSPNVFYLSFVADSSETNLFSKAECTRTFLLSFGASIFMRAIGIFTRFMMPTVEQRAPHACNYEKWMGSGGDGVSFLVKEKSRSTAYFHSSIKKVGHFNLECGTCFRSNPPPRGVPFIN